MASTWQHPKLISIYSSIAIVLFLTDDLHAQTKSIAPQNPVNPLVVSPIGFRANPNYAKPVKYGMPFDLPVVASLPLSEQWSFALSGSYQFLDQRSRVGAVSLDSESAVIDLAVAYNCRPYMVFDLAYAYSHANGSSPEGVSDIVNQNVGSVHVLQPLEPFFPQCKEWRPAALSTERLNNQFAIILGADYGASASSIDTPHLPSVHNSANTLLASALFDYQLAYFPCRPNIKQASSNGTNDCSEQRCSFDYPDDYASLFLEFSSGIQFNTLWLESSDRLLTSSGKQLTYQNIATLNYSFFKRFGFLVAAEWDSPLDSQPLHQSQRYYANTVTFTGGLTYNYYPGFGIGRSDHWSVSLLYSYTAFDPFTESNQLQVRVSYAF